MMQTETAGTSRADGKVTLTRTNQGIGIIRLGQPEERVVILTRERLASLRAALEELRKSSPKGLIIASASEQIFTAGADINVIRDVTDPKVGEQLSKEGQSLFDLIQSFPCTVVAAISGTCLGGGCELALACDYRVLSDSKRSMIGLPEIKLGILPGFGGTQRLPRITGLPQAADIILNGKVLDPKRALRSGLVDRVVKFELLEKTALDLASSSPKRAGRKLSIKDYLLTFNGIGRGIVAKQARKAIQRHTQGAYPAPPAALDCMLFGLQQGMSQGLLKESRELGRLISTPESKALVNLFFLTEAAKGLGKGAKTSRNLYAVVIGAGAMGAGIAGLLARHECNVILKDRSDEDIERGISQIRRDLDRSKSLSEADKSFVFNRIEKVTKESPNIATANFVIEAVYENLDLKRQVLSEVTRQMASDSIIATNTSSLPVTQIAAAIEHPERVVGMHFFNPVSKMPLIEIVRAEQTSDKILMIVAAAANRLGKYPIIVKDVPGFLVNRILFPYLNEAGFLLQEGYSIKDIDRTAVKFGMPMGPLRLLDEVGLDVAAHAGEVIYKGYGERMKSPAFVSPLVKAGRKGRKSKSGFYDYTDKGEKPHAQIRSMLQFTSGEVELQNPELLTDRLIMSIINEAVRCLDEGVAGTPGKEAADQIDLGSVMGFGFPAFRGGVLYYADKLGPKRILETLERLQKDHGERFAPWKGIKLRVQGGRSFHHSI